jgi:membrane protease YdiL (CAAX protease family)
VRLAFIALLVLVLGVLVIRSATSQRRTWGRFRRLTATRARQRVYRRWLIESLVVMGGMSAVLLVATWPVLGATLRSAQSWTPVAAAHGFLGGGLGAAIAVVLAVLVAAALIVPVIVVRGHLDEVPTIGDVGPLLPRNRRELRYGVGLALSAGVFEETMFRLALPALVFGIIGDASPAAGILAFAAASVVFGLLHAYQRWTGVLFTTVLGLVFSALYVVTGLIAVPVVLHAVVDLRALVLVPVMLGTARSRPAD